MANFILFAKVQTGNVVSQNRLRSAFVFCSKKVCWPNECFAAVEVSWGPSQLLLYSFVALRATRRVALRFGGFIIESFLASQRFYLSLRSLTCSTLWTLLFPESVGKKYIKSVTFLHILH